MQILRLLPLLFLLTACGQKGPLYLKDADPIDSAGSESAEETVKPS